MIKDMEKEAPITLSSQQVSFVRHFVRAYDKNFKKGNLEESHHDATAVLLYMAGLIGEPLDDH